MAKDPERMSFKELQEYELKVKKAKASVQERSRSELRQKLESIAANAGFKIGDLFAGRGGKGRKVAAKYANPDNPSETWTGRGRKPRWLAARLTAGEKQEKFLHCCPVKRMLGALKCPAYKGFPDYVQS